MFKSQIKTVLLLGGLTGLLLGIGQILGGRQGLIIGLLFAGGINFFSYWFSDKIVLKMYKAKEADQSQHSDLYQMVREITSHAKLPMPKIYVIETQQANAFATGRNPKHAAVAVTTGITQLLTKSELKGVLAHEIAHVKNRDILISSVAATVAGVISYLAMIARWGAIFGGFGGRDNDNGGIVELLVLAIVAPIMALIIQMAISRSREFLADETGAKLIRDPYSLASALEKIEANVNHFPLKKMGSTEATAHMFIHHPFRGKSMFKMFSTHPSTKERTKKLRAMKL
ncbi:zinc metalloprotease HtpX [Candidatus Woesearchaeota archaeon]|jgi:heat shock protein HtpX|nr:zinc metalloprotease HtpX [Candidatus Woesearchaeota archaeon]MBT4150836.1 zinc metalloprotease HtpX [Candidatus Woesearchaeota archaeon]MBT4246941.1 zinc metalloprotease HtpX [Candidatus Woesearchaeota archaeon]MBT4433626.1 zinc metalloprotease HtpX [Candidatus Woesearchaeota archaeon]MBT7332600.1 zinc metalloprotease HtpX [Candidatus Woesearchaeota archaeon]